MEYRCVTTSAEGFVQQLAVAYITHGYWFYVAGEIPEGKEPATVDAKLIDRYGIAITKWARCRRKRQGLANMQYLRHERCFVLIATKGLHEFFEREGESFRDVRRVPIKFAGYSIGCRKGRDGRWHASVRVAREPHAGLKALLVEIGLRRGADAVACEFARLQYQPFAPVRRQMLEALRAVNRARRTAGIGVLSADCLPLRRRIKSPFGEAGPRTFL
jgi:hypothetical protein